MGFSSMISRAKKFNPDATYMELNLIEHYFDYENNDWAKEHYKTFEEYCKNCGMQVPTYYIPKTVIDFYTPLYIQRENQYSKSIYEDLGDWCSSAIEFHEWLTNNFTFEENSDDGTLVITEEIAKTALKFICDQLDNYRMKPVIVKYAYTENDETGEIKSIPCTGVEVMDEDTNIKRIVADDFEYTDLYTPVKYFDSWTYDTWINLRDTFINIITTTDWKNNLVIYNGGW